MLNQFSFIYRVFCKGLHPKLILFVPHVILIQVIITAYTKRFSTPNQAEKNTTIKKEQYALQATQLKRSSSATTTTTTTGGSLSSSSTASSSRFSFATTFFPATDEASPEYLKNMQNLQNMMGEMSDLYDLIASNSHFVDWSSEAETMRVFQGILVSLLLMAIGLWFIPLNLVFLVGGVGMFLLNTRFAKFVVKEMMPQVTEIGQSQMKSAVQWYAQIEKRLDDQANVKEQSLYENQRWWAGSGFIPHVNIYICVYTNCSNACLTVNLDATS